MGSISSVCAMGAGSASPVVSITTPIKIWKRTSPTAVDQVPQALLQVRSQRATDAAVLQHHRALRNRLDEEVIEFRSGRCETPSGLPTRSIQSGPPLIAPHAPHIEQPLPAQNSPPPMAADLLAYSADSCPLRSSCPSVNVARPHNIRRCGHVASGVRLTLHVRAACARSIIVWRI